MASKTNPSTPKLSDAARILNIPDGIATTGFGRVRRVADRLGIRFDRWQEGIGTLMLAKRADGTYASSVGGIGMSICRQTGKTFTVGTIIVILCLTTPNLKVIWTAHRTRTSAETFKSMQALVKRPGLSRHCKAIRQTNGQEEIAFANGSRILFGAREQGFGRGFAAVDVIIFDEAQILTEKALEDMIPTANAAKNPLIIHMGTPPRPVDPGEVFTGRRTAGLAHDPDSTWIEFGADRDCDTADPDAWAQANPSYPHRTPASAMLRMLKNLGEDSFRREALGIWDQDTEHAAIDPELWAQAATPERASGGWTAMAIDMPPHRGWITIGACQAYEDGTAYIDIAALKGVRKHGTKWPVDFLARRWPHLAAVVIDAQSPATVLIPPLKAAGIDVTVTSASDMGKACGRLLDMLQYHELRHKPDVRPLDQAVAGATVRKIGVEGAFGWNKLGSDVDISPLVAATLALHGAVTSTRRPGDEPEQRMIELP